uniref:fibronectin type III domain-containing protein 7-like n=1 Tax=Monopterus albus TaxID=43700 RepID=UPI0009B43DFC
PCTPAQISSMVDCQTNALTVFWSNSSGADSYIATVQDSHGLATTCQGTTTGSCSVTGLSCGQIYHISVVSSDGHCNSTPTPVADTPSAPCQTRNVGIVYDCNTQIATVWWTPTAGAWLYSVTLKAASGYTVICETSFSYCEIDYLLCGRNYSVSVQAWGWTCSATTYLHQQLAT